MGGGGHSLKVLLVSCESWLCTRLVRSAVQNVGCCKIFPFLYRVHLKRRRNYSQVLLELTPVPSSNPTIISGFTLLSLFNVQDACSRKQKRNKGTLVYTRKAKSISF